MDLKLGFKWAGGPATAGPARGKGQYMSTIYRWGELSRTLSLSFRFPLSADRALSQLRAGTGQGLLLDSSGTTVPNDTSGPKNFFVIDSAALEAGSSEAEGGAAA